MQVPVELGFATDYGENNEGKKQRLRMGAHHHPERETAVRMSSRGIETPKLRHREPRV
jgi:hypothetical protein